MMAIFALLKPMLGKLAPYLIMAGAAGAAWLYISHLRNEVAVAQANNAVLQSTVANDAKQMKIIDAERQMADRVLVQTYQDSQKRRVEVRTIYRSIHAAPAGQNGPVAPVLANTLAKLRAAQGGAQ